MKRVLACVLAWCMASSAMAQCDSVGWRLVSDRQISANERVCVYEKNGAQVSIMVRGLCPLSPC